MLHQDGSRAAWLASQPMLDLIVTMDDATSKIYSAFLIEEEGTVSTFQALLEVFTAHGLPSSLYTDRGSHYFHTPKADGPVDKTQLTQVGRALKQLGIEHIPAYSPEARGRSERMFGTLQDRLIKELAQAGITEIAAANAWIREVYLPRHNARFAKPPAVAAERLRDGGCGGARRDAVRAGGARGGPRQHGELWRPQAAIARKARCAITSSRRGCGCTNIRTARSPCSTARAASPATMPKASDNRGSPDAPKRDTVLAAVKAWPGNRGDRRTVTERRPSLTAAARGVTSPGQVGTKKRSARSNQETATAARPRSPQPLEITNSGRGVHRFQTAPDRFTQEADN